MTTLIKPFRALRPADGRAEDVAAPPYDVLNTAEARDLAAGKPYSFLHISKPEIDLPEGTDPYSTKVYEQGARSFHGLIEAGILLRDATAGFYVYRLRMGEHEQTGLAFVGSVAEYDRNRIRKHEYTRPKKEDDRVRQITALGAQTGPVLLAYRSDALIGSLLADATKSEPVYDIVADGDVGHTIWLLDDADTVRTITETFDAMDALYIADGHHRSAAASRVAAARRESAETGTGDEACEYFLCVAFPHDEMQIFDYNRVVRDTNGLTAAELLARIADGFRVTPSPAPVKPARPGTFGMYLEGRWHSLAIKAERVPADDPVARLDVSLLQNNLIEPVLDIADPRTDDRIDFVGGIRGLEELERRVDSGEMAVAFALYPTSMEDLMAVADANAVMPPKSTWFEPKLADGLVSHVLD